MLQRLNTINDFKLLRQNDKIMIIDKNNEMLKGEVSCKLKRFILAQEIWVDIPEDNLELCIGVNKYLKHKGWFRSIFREI